jgi:predicted NBD/HSP70 family sugar kinase
MGRPAKDNEPTSLVALQGHLLAEAARAGVPVNQETLERAATALARFSATDLKALEAVAGSPLALEALARLADENPDAFLKHYAALLEFSRPKLARVEHQHEGNPLTGIFIAVEQRESGPPPALAGKVVSGGS